MNPIRIFIVEDDLFLSNLYKITLQKLDRAEVHVFAEGQECINQLHLNPEVVTIDYHLPGMNGLELMEKMGMQDYMLFISQNCCDSKDHGHNHEDHHHHEAHHHHKSDWK